MARSEPDDGGGVRRASERVGRTLTVVAFAALPTVGLLHGPAYAPIVFTLAAIACLTRVADRQAPIALDRPLLALILGFVAWAAVSTLWSIDPGRTVHGTLQLAELAAGSILLLTMGRIDAASRGRVLAAAAIALFIGPALAVVDMATQYRAHELLPAAAIHWSPTKYNRGVDYLVILAAPILHGARAVYGSRTALVLAVLTAAVAMLSQSVAARAEVVVAVAVFAMAQGLPRLTLAVSAGMVSAMAILVPPMIGLVTSRRDTIALHLKRSGLHRLEIWDYMNARILERPTTGWGFSTAKAVPISDVELSRYVYVSPDGIYPHNQWLEVWIGGGAVAAAIALAFAILVLRRISQLPADARPYAYAAFAAAMVVANVNFEITTDSWWAAIAATAFLFKWLPGSRAAHPATG